MYMNQCALCKEYFTAEELFIYKRKLHCTACYKSMVRLDEKIKRGHQLDRHVKAMWKMLELR